MNIHMNTDRLNDIKEAAAAKARKIKADIQASRKSDETDDPIDVFVYDPIAIRLTYLFIKLGWSANAVTLSSLFFGVGGAFLLYPKNVLLNLLGVACEIFAAILDCSDGQVARLAHTSSQFGRLLDGAVDMANYVAIYLAVGFRLMDEFIPFTGERYYWSWRIWIVIVLAMLFHSGQARMADYYRGLHLTFLKGHNETFLGRSAYIRKELAELPADSPLFKRIYLNLYLAYTLIQENGVPQTQRLLDRIDEDGGTVPALLAERYTAQSRKWIQITNLLSFNIRTYTLFLLLLLGKEIYFFPFVFLVLEGLKYAMIARYETMAGHLYAEYYGREAKPSAGRHTGRRSL